MEANDMKAMREALEKICDLFERGVICTSYANTAEEMEQIEELYSKAKATLAAPPRNCDVGTVVEPHGEAGANCPWKKIRAALSAPPHTGKWENGTRYEYEYAYCSACSRMQWASWDSHRQAEEGIESFADNYKFCPGCGAKMEGGVYVK